MKVTNTPFTLVSIHETHMKHTCLRATLEQTWSKLKAHVVQVYIENACALCVLHVGPMLRRVNGV